MEAAESSAPALVALPGIVSTEIPQMAFQIAAAVEAATVILVSNLHDNLGSSRFGAGIVRIGIVDDDVGTLRPGAADLLRRLDPAPELVVARRTEHDHAVPEDQLG